MYKPVTLWLTGLSGSGKSTLAFRLEADLRQLNVPVSLLDGDEIRKGLCCDLGFTFEDRTENVRRTAEVARLMNLAGVIVIVALISPLEIQRKLAKSIVGNDQYREIFIDASIDACERRDVKGLYKKARQGKIIDFTGLSSPYEPPQQPDLWLQTGEYRVDDCSSRFIHYVRKQLGLGLN